MAKRALITGVTGQDGSYLAELLLDEGYEVIGMVRRSSTLNFERIAHIQDRVTLVAGDLVDEASMINILREHRPEEVYNLAAQSFVQTSWSQPVLTGETTALGVTRVLDAIRIVDPEIRFYQASSSEMFGKVVEVPQRETTPFYPRSPYGVAKVYGHWITVNYRESYNLHASSGMLFNHESVPATTPVVVRRDGYVDVVAIAELIPLGQGLGPHDATRITVDGGGLDVWDGQRWSRCLARSAYWHDGDSVVLSAPGGVIECTPDHVVSTPTGDRAASELRVGERVRLADQPFSSFGTVLTTEEAWLLGVLAAVGEVSPDGHGSISCDDAAVLAEAAACWCRLSGGTAHKSTGRPRLGAPGAPGGRRGPGDRAAPQPGLPGEGHAIEPAGSPAHLRMLGAELYTEAGGRRVPRRVLNAAPELQRTFVDAYVIGQGSRGLGDADGPVRLRTSAAVLSAGLVWLARTALGRRVTVLTQPEGPDERDGYVIDLSPLPSVGRSASPPGDDELGRVERHHHEGWMCDLATESERFAAGVGLVAVHNSPRRGLEFVTRKISHTAARIKLGIDRELRLGNLDAQRDWGFAGDYVRAMHLMLQQNSADDFVVCTGETHAVREFCELAFGHLDLDYRDHVVIDERFMRPAEVELLVGDASKARTALGWEPATTFASLVAMMVSADIDVVRKLL